MLVCTVFQGVDFLGGSKTSCLGYSSKFHIKFYIGKKTKVKKKMVILATHQTRFGFTLLARARCTKVAVFTEKGSNVVCLLPPVSLYAGDCGHHQFSGDHVADVS